MLKGYVEVCLKVEGSKRQQISENCEPQNSKYVNEKSCCAKINTQNFNINWKNTNKTVVVKDRVDETGIKSQIFLIPMPVENYKETASLFFLLIFQKMTSCRTWAFSNNTSCTRQFKKRLW